MMGVHIDHLNFATIDLVKDLEIARHALNNKIITPITEIPVENPLDELLEEQSDDGDLIVLTPKRKSKSLVRLSLSGPKKEEARVRESLPKTIYAWLETKESMVPPLSQRL